MDTTYDESLSKIAAYVTFDGHLAKDLKGFYLSSGNSSALAEFEELVIKKFGLTPFYEDGVGFGYSRKCRFFSAQVSRFLHSCGVPNGDKMVVSFDVPEWIKSRSILSRVYLAVAFQCEGSIYKRNKTGSSQISFKMVKSEELVAYGLDFMDQLKVMLNDHEIETTKLWVSDENLRKKDGKRTKSMTFKLRTRSLTTFYDEIGFNVDEKKNALLKTAARIENKRFERPLQLSNPFI